jgi:hypothetical protein
VNSGYVVKFFYNVLYIYEIITHEQKADRQQAVPLFTHCALDSNYRFGLNYNACE